MKYSKTIKRALISVFYKDGLDKIVIALNNRGVELYSTGGTFDFIQSLGIQCHKIEDLTGYPSVLGGRVKTLHPKVFGGILGRPQLENDNDEMLQYQIEAFDLVVVNLYPFEQTMASGANHLDIIEKIDIGGISLIRAAGKNYENVLCVSSPEQYAQLLEISERNPPETSLEERMKYAAAAFRKSSTYDTAICNYMMNAAKKANIDSLQDSSETSKATTALRLESHTDSVVIKANYPNKLRYGENPHQEGVFYGNLEEIFDKLHGKELSYNNLLDLEAGLSLINDFDETTFAILKHNNACGIASREKVADAWKAALEADPVSAYGGVLICNKIIDEDAAKEINKIFFEILVAPDFEKNTLEILQTKKNRIILRSKTFDFQAKQFRSLLNGVLMQDKDNMTELIEDLKVITNVKPSREAMEDLLFANKVVKHTKSNAIVLASGKQLLASGTGQTSRVDALRQAIEKAGSFGLNLNNAVMASDAFFPFADSVEIAHKAGISSVIQPGGSVRDQETIDYCNANEISMVFTGIRHFKH